MAKDVNATGIVEDDDGGGAGGLGVEDLHAEEAAAALDQGDMAAYEAGEVG